MQSLFKLVVPSARLAALGVLGIVVSVVGGPEDEVFEPLEAKPPPGVGVCLGNCRQCYSLLEALPREPLAAATTHTDPARVEASDIESWLGAPEVCDIRRLYPVSLDREMWSLASLPGGLSQLKFPGARSDVRTTIVACRLMQDFAVATFAEARSISSTCADSVSDVPVCLEKAPRDGAAKLLIRWQKVRPQAREGVPASVDEVLSWDGNETKSLVESYLLRVDSAIARLYGLSTRRMYTAGIASQPLTHLALEVGRLGRLLVEHTRTIWGIKEVLVEVGALYPTLPEMLPPFQIHSEVYGRHWDVLERLLHSLAPPQELGVDKLLRMSELGVACGPIGLYLMQRFPSLQYFGADPTIVAEVHQAYSPYNKRAQLFENISEEMHRELLTSPPMDLVFIDGPHTYKNVRHDLELWGNRIRTGGIIAGHDFTCRHPPLLWAVIEYRIQNGGGPINIAMDGVWWWQVDLKEDNADS